MKVKEIPRERGSIKELTVLIADLHNFTRLVQRLELPEMLRFLDDFYSLICDEAEYGGGMLNKFMGDAVLIVYGALPGDERHGETAVKTALRIEKRFKKLCHAYRKTHACYDGISLGIGISRGKVFIGKVGSAEQYDYTVVGTAVNAAQRIAAHANNNGNSILVTGAVTRDMAGNIMIKRTSRVTLRGFDDETTVHEIALDNGG